jgi:hypothetical protein
VALGLKAHELDKRFSPDSVRESRIVLDAAGVPKQSSGLAFLEDDGADSGTPELDRGGEPGRAGADNADVGRGHVCPPNAASISSINTGIAEPRERFKSVATPAPPNSKLVPPCDSTGHQELAGEGGFLRADLRQDILDIHKLIIATTDI